MVAYGRIIPEWMLNLPRWGNINLHASLLPKYRGAAPIQWAVANGETVTGATTMRIDQGLDTGDMLLQRSLSIEPDQTAEQLFPLLAESGAGLMRETLEGLEAGTIHPIPQDNAGASLAPILQREDALVDFTRLCRRDLQPLAWFSTLARSLHPFSRPKADSASFDPGRFHRRPSRGNDGGRQPPLRGCRILHPARIARGANGREEETAGRGLSARRRSSSA